MSEKNAGYIFECKKASPSKGLICPEFDPAAIAKSYEAGGAACLSVLTDVDFFQGSDEYLRLARAEVLLPVLRKDFIVSSYQVYESRAIGADCILLIASVLTLEEIRTLYDLAVGLDMDVLIEVHDKSELKKALSVSPRVVGINNRDLKTFSVDLETTLQLLAAIPNDVTVVTESGISDNSDIVKMMASGVFGFLIGEALMKEEDPGAALISLFADY